MDADLAAMNPLVAESLDPRRMHLILFPTEACNFRCTYCYEDFEHGHMRRDVIDGVKALLSRRLKNLDWLQINWFGGEPLLAMKVVREISHHVLREVAQCGTRFSANITTNASLLAVPLFRELFTLGVSQYQISLDGDRDVHNRSRISASRQGTFDQIWDNLVAISAAKDVPSKIILRAHYSPDTWEQLSALVERINGAFADDQRFAVYFKALERLGGPNDHKLRTVTEKSKLAIAQALEQSLARPSMAYRLANGGQYICYAAKGNSFAVRANGHINKCTVALKDPVNDIGILRQDGSVEIKNELWRNWLLGLESMVPSRLACPYGQMQTRIKNDNVREDVLIRFPSKARGPAHSSEVAVVAAKV